MKINGIYTPVITPFHDDLSIDYDGFAVLLEHLIAAGVDGIVLAGTTGEYYAHSKEERVAMMHAAREITKARIPLVIGVGALATDDAVYFAGEAAKAGADAILLNAPYYALPTQKEMAEHAQAVNRAANLPIVLYNYPARTGVGMDKEFLDSIICDGVGDNSGGTTNFCAIKESSGDINRLHMLVRDYPKLQISCGMDDQALEFFAWGASSWICAASNFLPAAHIALYRAVLVDNDIATGRRIMHAMLPLMAMLEGGGKFVQCVKYGCASAGLAAGKVRKPLAWLSDDEQRAMDVVVGTLKESMARIIEPAER